MDIKSEVIKIVDKVMGKTPFLSFFFDAQVLNLLKQIDYIHKTFNFKGPDIDFIDVGSLRQLFELVKSRSEKFEHDYNSFCSLIYNAFSLDILKNKIFNVQESAAIIGRVKEIAGADFNISLSAFERDKVTYSRLFAEILKAARFVSEKTKRPESELMAVLNRAVYEFAGEDIINKGFLLINMSRRSKEVVSFFTAVEGIYKIKLDYAEINTGDIFTNIYKAVREQRPDYSIDKVDVENEMLIVATKIFTGRSSFLDVCFRDPKVLKVLQQFDYIQKHFKFNAFADELSAVKTVPQLFETVKKNSSDFNMDFDSFCELLRVHSNGEIIPAGIHKKTAGVFNFLAALERIYEIKIDYSDIHLGDIFANIYRLLREQRPGYKYNKQSVEQEIMAIAAKIFVGKSSFIDVSFFDADILKMLIQLDYVYKNYNFKGASSEFIDIKSFRQLFDVVKKYSPGFLIDFNSFCSNYYSVFYSDISCRLAFSKDEAVKVIDKIKSGSALKLAPVPDSIFSERTSYETLFNAVKNAAAGIQAASRAEIEKCLKNAIYHAPGEKIIERGVLLINMNKRARDVIKFINAVEKNLKIQINYPALNSGDIFENIILLLKTQRPDFKFDKEEVEHEIMSIASQIFSDSNILLNLINSLENKYKVKISKDDSIFAGSFDAFINVVTRAITRLRPAVAPAEVSLDVMAFASEFMSRSEIKVADLKLDNAAENKFISDIEKKFHITFSVFDLMEIEGFESIIKIVEKLIKKQKVYSKHPGLFPDDPVELPRYIRREIIRTTRDNRFIGGEMMSDSLVGFDFPRKLESIMAGDMITENKFISDIEKKFHINFSVSDLKEISDFESIVKIVEELIIKQKINEKFPASLPASRADLNPYIRREVISSLRGGAAGGADIMITSFDGLDFPGKLDSMLAIEVVVQLEKKFRVKIPEEKLYVIKSVEEITALIEKLLAEKNKNALPGLTPVETKDRI